MIKKITEYKAKMVLEKVDLAKLVSETVKLDHHLRAPCPLHKGDDNNFSLWPRPTPLNWTCHSQCGSGNAIQFVMKRDNLTNEQAIEWLFDKHLNLTMPLQHANALKPAPVATYCTRLADFCQWAHGQLMNTPKILDFCLSWGWTVDLLREWQVGYNPKSIYLDFGTSKQVYASYGVVFPYLRRGNYLTAVMRRLRGEKPKYMALTDGRRGLFGVDKWQNHEVLVLTEGEKDAITGHYVLGDQVNFGAMGGSKAKPDPWDSLYLAKHKRIVTLYDNDKSGNDGAQAMGFEAIRLQSGDLTDYLAAHGRASTRRMLESLLFDEDSKTCDHPTIDFWKGHDIPMCMVCGALLSEWSDERIERYYADIRDTVYPSDKVGKIMAVLNPKPLTPKVNFHAKQNELFAVATSGREYYE